MSGALKKTSSIPPEQELKILSEISNVVQQAQASKESLEEILKHLGKIVDYRSASIYLVSADRGKLQEACTIGRKVDLINFVSFEMGSGISAWVAKHKRPIVLNNLRKSKGGTHTKSFLSVPMIFEKEIIGVINLAHDESGSFSHCDADIVAIAASMIALLVERMGNCETIARLKSELESLSCVLKSIKERASQAEKTQTASDLAASLNQKINNPLAIISGNAQFLMMTMKNSSSSVLKRLKAIDREASNILLATQKLSSAASDSSQRFSLSLTEENHHSHARRGENNHN